jgi:aminoglycoside phosphotransferase (APT) family kinase protein
MGDRLSVLSPVIADAASPRGDLGQADIVARLDQVPADARTPLLITEPLAAYLSEKGLGVGPLTAHRVGEGQSNVVFALARDDLELVLRRPPRLPYSAGSHDVLREARILQALGQAGLPVPTIRAICDDDAVIGAPFFVMDRVPGHIVGDRLPPALDTPAARRRIGLALVDTLADIHTVDWQNAGLDWLARRSDYIDRQLRRFSSLWEENRTRPLADLDAVADWLGEHRPPPTGVTIVHGDFRLGNVMLADDPAGEVAAVLDWELTATGEPLADLGYLSALWVGRDDPGLGLYEFGGATRREGFASRVEIVHRYQERTGRDVSSVGYYMVLALWKSAVIMEGNHRRALAGSTGAPSIEEFRAGVAQLVRRAAEATATYSGARWSVV